MRLASMRGWAKARVDRGSECWPQSSWARSPRSRVRGPSMPAASPTCLRARRIILQRRCPQASAICWVEQACSTRLAVRRGRRLLLIPLLAIAALLIYFFARPAEQVAQQGVTAVQGLTVGGLDVAKQVTDSVTSLRTTLGSITDAASARAALPKLQEVTTQIDRVDALLGQLSPEQRKVLAGMVNPLMPSLNQLLDKVLAIPGVAELLKPTIDTLRAKLAVLTA